MIYPSVLIKSSCFICCELSDTRITSWSLEKIKLEKNI